ncbi:hypothetical protein [Streptomyces prunicolor]
MLIRHEHYDVVEAARKHGFTNIHDLAPETSVRIVEPGIRVEL